MVAILVVLTVVGFLLVDWTVQLVQVRRGGGVASMRGMIASMVSDELKHCPDEDTCEPPSGLFFHPGHCWVQIEREGVCRIGVDGLISRIVGRVDKVYLPKVGEEVKEGDPIASITQGPRVMSFRSPMDGVIAEVNEKLRPGLLRSKPYTDGWLFAIRPRALEVEARRLALGSDALNWHRLELQRIAEYFTSLPELAKRLVYDSRTGSPIIGPIMEGAPESDWKQFQHLFLEARN